MNVVTGLDNTDYQRHRDTVSDYYNDLNYYNGRYNQEYGYDYGQYQDQVAADQWAQEFAFQKQQAAQEQANWEAEMALARQKAASSGGSGGRRRSSSSKKKSSSSSSTTTPTKTWAEAYNDYVETYKKEGADAANTMMSELARQGAVDVVQANKNYLESNAAWNAETNKWRKKWLGTK